ncbi:bifunctional pyr operon transcriptional regulator/uracil phosphoribosyltransferase PyrR [Thiothrix lacustris]|jgi:pyrimidine operon attenuation protein/uracil phosphoribosyltransferase|uniref:Bifunctional pyr operon transcriptional regulator/uracil phosphoribosyltransferase PyrR n=1 Tax=Thiothrix lacustris TaxID=525917 RepID=A0ABY9MWF2_9GAMM|nr:bifunctional pyr operon transcriptional regulator/uracil phosphoribosyltransferase PyrR [Thiothrix lacustris]WML92326.1 bifunctional pyr operon transcriptional regulator/uracil phosphoribosyltransferase PyrR [Thiothrix lacustris]WMP19264.1 bifunctional pyr operon transcriptional regulator/uracil phosphoribosyltransferase PyrR [Thiothrix lacustris]
MDNKNYNVTALLDQLEQQTRQWIQKHRITNPVMVGLHTGGVWVAQALHRRLNIQEELGELSTTFYRDDFSQVGLHRQQKPSRLPFEIENRHVLLVDDVIYTGRTLRGAMNELFDFGRPASITAIALIAREGRELPIEPQIVALHEEPGSTFRYQISGPEPLTLQLLEA